MADNTPNQATPAQSSPQSPVDNKSAVPAKAKSGAAPATNAEIRKLKLKLDGGEVELPEDQVIALAQQSGAAQKRFAEAARARKQAEEILTLSRTNPAEFVRLTGGDAKAIRKFAEDFLIEQLKHEHMSPEQKTAAAERAELKKFKEAERRAQESEQAKKDQTRHAAYVDQFDKMFTTALAKADVPKTPYSVKRMAELTQVNLKKGLNYTSDELAEVVAKEYRDHMRDLLGGYTDDSKIADFIGPDLIKRLTKAQISKLKSKGLQVKASSTGYSARNSNSEGRSISWKAFQKINRGRS